MNQESADPVAAALQSSDTDEDVQLIDPQQLCQEQNQNLALTHVQVCVMAGQQPALEAVSGLDPETKAFYSQWDILTAQNSLLYHHWRSPGGGREILQLLIPQGLRGKVFELVREAMGGGHFGV